MRVAISIAEHEIPMAHRWMDWVIELGGTDGHHLHLIFAGNSSPVVGMILPKANKAFNGNVSTIKDEEEQTSDWQITEPMRSASGPNSSFRQVAWHFYHAKLGPYFWCELDCIPLQKDWLDRLEAEYKTCGKPFMGANVEIENVPPHMSGNGVYVNVPEQAPTLIQRTEWRPKGQGLRYELAFDIAGAREVMPKAHFTNLIQHKFRFKGFESRYEFDAVIDKNAVVFHSDKKGTIFPYLRENLGIVSVQTEPSHVVNNEVRIKQGEAREALDTAIFNDAGSRGDAQNIQGGDASWGTNDTLTETSSSNAEPTVQSAGSANVVTKTFTPSDELETVIEQNKLIHRGLPAMSPPWENREDTERDVKMLCDTLALFCKTTVYKGRVRNALREAKIIK